MHISQGQVQELEAQVRQLLAARSQAESERQQQQQQMAATMAGLQGENARLTQSIGEYQQLAKQVSSVLFSKAATALLMPTDPVLGFGQKCVPQDTQQPAMCHCLCMNSACVQLASKLSFGIPLAFCIPKSGA